MTTSTQPSAPASVNCQLYAGAFSGEVVFAIETVEGSCYEGVAPKRNAHPSDNLSHEEPQDGSLDVRQIQNGGDRARIELPDGTVVDVNASKVKSRQGN